MIVTEQEAKKKWCPHLEGDAERRAVCIGSRCMAWRLSYIEVRRFTVCDDQLAATEPPRPDTVPATYEWRPHEEGDDYPAGWWEPEAECDARRKGYCGLVGEL